MRSHGAIHPPARLGARFVALAALLSQSAAQAQTIDEQLWSTNGNVNAVVESGGVVYLGGTFSSVGRPTGTFAPLDAASGAVLSFLPAVVGDVRAICPDGSGGWYIGGNFTSVGGVPRSGIAHVAPDFSVSAWDPNVTGTTRWVSSLAISGPTLYVGGHFAGIGGQPRDNLAALDVTTGSATSWDPSVTGVPTNVIVLALAVGESSVYVGGNFDQVGGQPRRNIAAIDIATGVPTDWDPVATGHFVSWVYDLALDGPAVYAAGYFTSIGGQPRKYIAALDAATGSATAWNPSANTTVLDLALSGSTVYAAGAFTSIGGQARNHIAALDASTGSATEWNPDAGAQVNALALGGSAVYVGGAFLDIGGQPRSRIAALDAVTGAATAWDPSASGVVYDVAASASAVAAGGIFQIMGGVARANIAALDATTGAVTAWNPGANSGVEALAVSGSTVYAGGSFTSIGGQPRNRIAALDATSGLATSWNPNSDDVVRELEVSGAVVFAGGSFGSIGGQPRTLLAALDRVSGAATSWVAGFLGGVNLKSVDALAVAGTTVYAGGEFTMSGGTVILKNVAAFDGGTGAPTGWLPDQATPAPVRALEVSGSTVYLGGSFATVGTEPRAGIAAVDAVTGSVTAWNPAASPGVVNALALGGSTVYAGGSFTAIGGAPRAAIAAIDAGSGLATLWNPILDTAFGFPVVYALALTSSTVYAGGAFGGAGGMPHIGIAAIQADATAVPDGWADPAAALRLDCFPNPFRYATSIRFVLPAAARAGVDVFDVAGRRVASPMEEMWLGAGSHEVDFRSRSLPSGVYLCRLRAGGETVTKKMLVRR
jgi:hypothetical protein